MKKSISVLLFFASAVISAEPTQSPEILTRKIEQYIHSELAPHPGGKVHVTADKIDSHLSFKACAENKLVVFNPYQTPVSNTSTFGIKCQEQDNHWSLYVPVRITILKKVYIAHRAMMKGERINGHDMYQAEIDVHQLKYGYFEDIDDLAGHVCKQNIPIDSPFNPHNVELAKIIRKGEKVAIVTNNNNLTVSMDGIAIDEGTMGDSIKVKNLSSKKIIEAQITGKKRVTVVF